PCLNRRSRILSDFSKVVWLENGGESTLPAFNHATTSTELICVGHFSAVLAKDGHKVTLQKIQDWNVVELVVNEEVVFSCNIKDLEFGGDGKLDPLCEKARIAVLNAY
uniref:Uncharacterized protein n=1 Tax=Suricata suricatta TaxID=37032 RepID=A0A673T444_SURSU